MVVAGCGEVIMTHPEFMKVSRRNVLKAGAGFLLSAPLLLRAETGKAEAAAQSANNELWRRMIDKHDVMLDFADEQGKVIIPTPEECRLGKPNALGWWSPIENGGFFNGLYIDAMIDRWKVTNSKADAEKVRRMARGLMKLASVSEVKGFVARGMGTDGVSHYPMGSNDQTAPWQFGIWRYLQTDLPDKAERAQIVAKVIEMVEVIIALGWKMPAEEPFKIRGQYHEISWESSPRVLFVLKWMHQLTGDSKWDKMYQQAMQEVGGKRNISRLAACEGGMIFEHGPRHSWTASIPNACLRGLWEMETAKDLKAAYAKGLQAGATVAMESLPIGMKFDNEDVRKFEHDWRVMNQWWKPQQTEQEAVALAQMQLREYGKLAPRRGQEVNGVREPAFAAWVVALAPDKTILKERRAELEKIVAHYRYERLLYSQFFPLENVWWKLRREL